jgi:hypothetical protein
MVGNVRITRARQQKLEGLRLAAEKSEDDCAAGLHSWIHETGKLPPDTKCTRCGEPYGNPK